MPIESIKLDNSQIEQKNDVIFLKLKLQGVLGAVIKDATLVDVYYAPPILYLPEELESLGTSCFSGQTDLKEIRLPSNLKEIDKLVFTNCPNLKKIIIPDKYKNDTTVLRKLVYCNNANIEFYEDGEI